MAAGFAEDGELAAFDGMEFDVLHHGAVGAGRARRADCDADGQPDGGVFDGVQRIRGRRGRVLPLVAQNRVGERTSSWPTVTASTTSGPSDRSTAIESEGWPSLSDWEIRDWSGGLNRHFFWSDNARPPVFNYVNHKFTTSGEQPGQRMSPDVPMEYAPAGVCGRRC